MDESNLNAQDGQGPNFVPDGGDGNKLPLKRKVAIGATVALVVAGLGLGGAWATGAFAPKSEITKIEADGDGGKKQVSGKTDRTVDWAVKIEAEGVTADSSPLITRYVCTDGADEGVEFYHATPASDAIEGKDSVQLTEGTWEITAIPIINADGSITTPAGGGEQAVSGDQKDSVSTEFTGDTKPAGDVTQDDIDKVLDKVNEAVSKGDGTLTGDAGKPSHEHTWQAQYRNDPVYETRTRTVVDQDAWDEQVLSGSHYQFSDGYITSDDADAWAHQKATHASYTVVDDYTTIHHEAVTHQETYQVQTGTKQVLIGYRCSGCGATK